ncbi:hypothetical protein [Acetobacter aceti]|uniref:hypothetical protein n=1 Tax=Acetobacter aceti TaxID=435 RepID=UPI000C070CD8|nr:hypothetical protein [Acetobacter aceti]
MQNTKYELLENDTVTAPNGAKLFRIRALVAIAMIGVSAGDLGGYVESQNNLSVFGNAWVFGNARVFGDAWVSGNARVKLSIHVGWHSHVGSENGTLTWFRSISGISVNRGCFNGTLNEFRDAVQKNHGDSVVGQEYRHLIEFIELRASQWIPAIEKAA